MRLIDADAFSERMKSDPLFPLVERYGLSGVIEAQPTIDPVKHGRWVKTGQSFLFPNRFRNYSCSLCGYDIDKTKYRYCPNCGARNEVEE